MLYYASTIALQVEARAVKDLKFGPLCDVYGPLLTEKQRELAEWYYDDDLTLS